MPKPQSPIVRPANHVESIALVKPGSALARFDHIAVTPEELSDEVIRSLRTAQARPEAIALNELMD